jgi:hypothetical protein
MALNQILQSPFAGMLAYEVGADAYIFGFPLVLMDATRELYASSAMNCLTHARELPDYRCADLVRPNVDTLYSSGFLDLSQEPMVLHVPEVNGRYCLIQLMDAWTNIFASLGTRTTGHKKKRFVIAGPISRSKVPEGIPAIVSPTNLVYISVRTYTSGIEDSSAVQSIQDRYLVSPLQTFDGASDSQVSSLTHDTADATMSPLERITRMSPEQFLNRLTTLMKYNPPPLADANILRGLLSVGIVPGRPIKFASMKPALARGLESGCVAGFQQISQEAASLHGKIVNGWQFSEELGRYGTRYLWRAAVAMSGLGATLPDDIIYARAACDGDGTRLVGSKRYLLQFENGNLPPVHAFWSLTLYDEKQALVANPLNRSAIGDRDRLTLNPDGSLTLCIQHNRPVSDSNWLPAPSDGFSLLLRLYSPGRAALDGSWKPPRIEVVSTQAKASA